MTQPKVIALLIAAAFAVGVQNYLFWSQQPGALQAVEEDDEEIWEEQAENLARPLPTVPRAQIFAWRDETGGVPRNPFVTLDELGLGGDAAAAVEENAPPMLQGTLWSRERRIAWIDGRPHREGDALEDGDHVVERIDVESVVLRRGIQRWTLGMNEEQARPANEAKPDER